MKACLIMLLCVFSTVNAEPMAPVFDNSNYPSGDGTGVVKPSSPANATYEIMVKLEQLQAEVQRLTGKLEEQENLIAEIKKSQATMYSDLDGRIQALEKKAEGVKPAAAENIPLQEGLVGAEAKQAEPPVANPVAPPAAAKQIAPQKQDAVQASGDEKQQYQRAYETFRNGHTAEAIAEFNALLTKNPKGEYANDAQYWLGEAYRVNQDTDAARKAFNNVVTNSPGSSKVPDALLKLSDIEVEQKNNVKAREYLKRVTVDFPSSKAARLAAKKLLLLDDVK
jgi:tol-pal system protein YbgF